MKKYRIILFLLSFFLKDLRAQSSSYYAASDSLTEHLWITSAEAGVSGEHYTCGRIMAGGIGQVYLSCVGNNGQVNWEKTYPEPAAHEMAYGMDADASGIYIGGVGSPVDGSPFYGYVIRLALNGEPLWKTIIDSTYRTSIESVECLADGGCIAVGSAMDPFMNEKHALILRLDSSGTVLWNFRMEIPGILHSELRNVDVAPDGYAYCVGVITDSGYYRHGLLIKTTMTGEVVWSKQFSRQSSCMFNDVVAGNSRVLIGASSMDFTTLRGTVLCLDTAGHLLRTKMHGMLGDPVSSCDKIKMTPYNTLAAHGTLDDRGYIAEFDTATFTFIRGTWAPVDCHLRDIVIDSNGIFFAGYQGMSGFDERHTYGWMTYDWYPGCGFEPYTVGSDTINLTESAISYTVDEVICFSVPCTSNIIMLDQTICVNPVNVEETSHAEVRMFPNPANEYLQVEFETASAKSRTITITDVEGRIVRTMTLSAPYTVLVIPVSDLACGIYFAQAEDQFLGKFVVEH